MARFDDDFIDRMKNENDIVALIESYGTRLKERPGGKGEFIGLCPVHDDKNPSLVANRKKNVWNCLGACGCGGDPIQWVMHAENVSFRHAVELLRDGSTGGRPNGRGAKPRKLDAPLPLSGDDHETLAGVVDYYHSRLKQSPDALAYLQKRFITDHEAVERFKIGFVDRTLGLRLPPKQNNKAGNEIRTRLKELGVTRETGHEHFRGCITFPLLDDTGRIKQIYGRRIDNKSKAKHFYLSQPMGGVLNLEAFTASDELILCESVIDALTFWCAGFRNVTTIYGTNGLTDELLQALQVHDIKRLLIAYDADKAGDDAAAKHAEKFCSLGIECFRTRVSDGAKDINGCAFLNGGGHAEPIRDTLGLLIRNAAWIGPGVKPSQASSAGAAKEKKPEQPTSKPASSKASSLAAEIPGVEVAKPAAADDQRAAEPPVEKQPPVASPQPPAPKEIEAEVKENGIVIEIGNRTYRVRGLEKNLAFDVLKLNVMVRRDEAFYVDTFDLYAAKARAVFIREAAKELGFDPEVIKRDLGKVLLKLESLQDKHIEDTLAVKDETIELTDKDKATALDMLRQPNLVETILTDFDACGVVGEEINKLVGYLAATSRKLPQPLAVLIQSSSAAGKSSLMEAVLAFMPPEDTIKYSAMTGQSLFYMGGTNLKHRILAIAEEEGVEQAAYALKLLQSEGELNIASTGKDPGTGRMETQEYHVEGPVMIFLTTTSDDTDPELKNRCVTLGVCEHACHTEAIHRQQRTRRTLDGRSLQHERKAIRARHQNAQRLLRPLEVVNNFAEQLTFRSDKTKSRRAHDHYLTLIEAVTLLHQYQRVEGTMVNAAGESVRFVETTLDDIELANRLADRFLERSFAELPERTQVLLEQLLAGLRTRCKEQETELWEQRFTRRDVRRWSTFGDTQLKEHLSRLVDYEYLKIEAGGGKGRSLEYSLSYDPDSDQTTSITSGLIDVNRLRSPDNSPEKAGEVGEKTEEVAPPENDSARQNTSLPPSSRENDENGQAEAA
ncbi:CHC2 zinc finger domain-containing protein [Allorhodopirellula solitaria]|uniref:DNA primase n=1 Tax=Allorhodopirellula solitaria TaxID=2527987 RepID=A0A5C5WY63_9BACT|nr:CHC2 zinc finger domain-containing protein [Allorhodopirellula solitaria]TWT55520.1 DNA primase [Allorhodopirellula solitaria]TWT55525.1 DNA primase [Allorhodopirellula solitaria]